MKLNCTLLIQAYIRGRAILLLGRISSFMDYIESSGNARQAQVIIPTHLNNLFFMCGTIFITIEWEEEK